jgi:integrase
VSLLTGARTEELRPLRWEHVHLDQEQGRPMSRCGAPFAPAVTQRPSGPAARSHCPCAAFAPLSSIVRRRTSSVSRRAGASTASYSHHELGPSRTRNVRREFRAVLAKVDGLDPAEWTPRELRHSFVSLLSDSGIPIEEISRLVGHSSTTVTEQVYRHQIRPVIQDGAIAMDRLFQ